MKLRWRAVKSKNAAKIGFGFLAMVILAAVLAPVITPDGALDHSTAFFQPPSGEHWLGTNDVGQDIFTRLLFGARNSLLVSVGVGLLSTFLSVAVGATAGLLGGIYDKAAMRFVDAILVIPPMVLVILVSSYFYPGNWQLTLFISFLTWPLGARVIRAQTLALKGKTHILAAKTFGAGLGHLIRRHIVPDLGPVITATAIQGARRAVFMEAGLAFLGITDPMRISWGKELFQALGYIHLNVWLWWLLPVGILLSLTLLAFTFIGYALEEALDPRL